MNEANVMADWLKSAKEACVLRAQELTADDRADEAKFEKIRANVFEIFGTVLSAGQKTVGNDTAALAFLSGKLEQIPANWAAACDKAEQYGDEKALHIERLKLDAVREIREKLTELMEEAK